MLVTEITVQTRGILCSQFYVHGIIKIMNEHSYSIFQCLDKNAAYLISFAAGRSVHSGLLEIPF